MFGQHSGKLLVVVEDEDSIRHGRNEKARRHDSKNRGLAQKKRVTFGPSGPSRQPLLLLPT